MRVGIVRSDINRLYLSDVENTSQRDFSAEPRGQSRYFVKPLSADLLEVLSTYAILSAVGDNSSATINTTSNHTLRIRTSAGSYSVIEVTQNAALTKAQLASDLNTAFTNLGLLVRATIVSNQLHLDTVTPNAGPTAKLQLDTNGNGSTLNAVVSTTWGASPPNLAGLALATFTSAVYPTATTINVATATIAALSTFSSMQAAAQLALVTAVQDAIAPHLVETGPVLLSFTYGILSKLRSSTFRPGGARIGLPAGVAAAIVQDDGSTPFTL